MLLNPRLIVTYETIRRGSGVDKRGVSACLSMVIRMVILWSNTSGDCRYIVGVFLLSSIDQLCFISKQCQSQSFTGGEEELPVRGMTEDGRFCMWTISGCDEYETGGLKNPYVLLNRRLMINTILPRMPFCSSSSSLLLILQQQQLPLRLVFHSVPCSFPLLLVRWLVHPSQRDCSVCRVVYGTLDKKVDTMQVEHVARELVREGSAGDDEMRLGR